jgi:hypothetical protein
MPKIGEWTEEARRTVTVAVEGIPEPVKGQGAFEIMPEDVEITYERWGKDAPEKVFKIKVRGPRVDAAKDQPGFGIRVWFPDQESHDPASVPAWVVELVEIFTRYDDLADQLRAGRKAIKWLRGEAS